jgi:hypothetical protein
MQPNMQNAVMYYKYIKRVKRMKAKLFSILALAMLLIMMPGCYSDESDTPYFPVARGETGMEALATGTLVLENGYLRLTTEGSSELIIWPEGYSLNMEGDEIQIFDEDGQVVARVGDTISAAGGEMGWINVLWVKGGFLPFNCQGPYWVSSEITKN